MRICVSEVDYKELVACKEMQECPTCNGRGKKQKIKINPSKKGALVFIYEYNCPVCKGTGFIK